MKIQLSKQVPKADGYYLMQFSHIGGLHLVLIQTELDGSRVMIPDDPKHYTTFKLNSVHSSVLKDALFTIEPLIIEKLELEIP